MGKETANPGSAPLTKEQAAGQVKMIAHLWAQLGLEIALRDAELVKVKELHEPNIEQLKKEIATRENLVGQQWAEPNRKTEFAGRQSVEFPHGWAKFRTGPQKLVYYAGWDADRTLEKVLAFGVTSQWNQYVKREPQLNGQKLLADAKGETPLLTPARLKIIGLRMEREEFFHVEPKPETAVQEPVG